MMAQLAYHISTGTPLWDYKVRKSTVLYFALEDDYPRLQKRLFPDVRCRGNRQSLFRHRMQDCKWRTGRTNQDL